MTRSGPQNAQDTTVQIHLGVGSLGSGVRISRAFATTLEESPLSYDRLGEGPTRRSSS